jgi:hypothetical protein
LQEIAKLFNEIQIKINDSSAKFESTTKLNTEMSESLESISTMIVELNDKTRLFVDEANSILNG